jgi:hypothetical protein
MKNILILSSMTAILSFTFLSCKKGVSSNAINTQNQFIQQTPSIDYESKYDNIINTVSYGLLDLSNNDAFKSILNAEINKKFDGDDNVLLKTLNIELAKNNIND